LINNASWIRSSELKKYSTYLFDEIYSLKFVKDSKTVVFMKKGHQMVAEEEKDKKNQGFSKNLLFRRLVRHQIYVNKS
jgi:hypothetical protein